MRLRVMNTIGVMALSSLLLTGCFAASPPSVSPSASKSASPSEPSSALPLSGCPSITAQDFAVQIETTVADPYPIVGSVGLDDALKGTCAYGFESAEVDGVAFFIVGPSEAAAAVFFGNAVGVAAKAGFAMGDTNVVGQSMTQSGSNPDGAKFLVAYFPDVESGDGVMPDASMAAIGLENGDSVILGSIQLAP